MATAEPRSIRRMLRHPDVELVRVASADHIGQLVGEAHLSLEGATKLRFEKLSAREAAEGVDVVMLALPRGVSAAEMPALLETGARIIDMSGDFRLKSAASYQRYYELAHPNPDLLADLRVRPARAQSGSDQRRNAGSVARMLRDRSGARSPASGAGGASHWRDRDGRHHGVEWIRRDPEPGNSPPGPRGQSSNLQAARAPARSRDRGDSRERQGRPTCACRSFRCRRRFRAESS